jgi:hypothetical protein
MSIETFIEKYAKEYGIAKKGKLLCFHKWRDAGVSYYSSQYTKEFQICMKCGKMRWKKNLIVERLSE